MSNNSEDVVINRTLKGIFIKSFMRDHGLDKDRMRALLKDFIYSGQKISLKDFLLKSIGKETSKMKAKKLKKFVSVAVEGYKTPAEKKELAKSPEAKAILKQISDKEKQFSKLLKTHNKIDKKTWDITVDMSKEEMQSNLDSLKDSNAELAALRKEIVKLQEKFYKLVGLYTYEVATTKKELAFNFNPDVIKRMLQMTHLFSSIDSDNIDQFTIVFKCRPKNMLSTEIPDTLFLGLTKLAKRTNYSFCVVCEPKLIRFCFTESM